MTNIIYYLIKSPASLKKLRDEVAGALPEKDVTLLVLGHRISEEIRMTERETHPRTGKQRTV